MTVRRVFFPANSGTGASQRVSFPILDDTIDEEPEAFIIVLYRDDNLTSVVIAFTPDRYDVSYITNNTERHNTIFNHLG